MLFCTSSLAWGCWRQHALIFTARLTQEFSARMGATPRFLTPEHPRTNGLVGRFNGTFKSMLLDMVQTNGYDWDRHIPFFLCAYREVPNVTTNESHFELMYGASCVHELSLMHALWKHDNRRREIKPRVGRGSNTRATGFNKNVVRAEAGSP